MPTLIQAYQINLSSLSGYISTIVNSAGSSGGSGSSVTPSGFLGYTGLTINSGGNWTTSLSNTQGIFTTRVNLQSGLNNNWTGNFIISNTNCFPGAIARYNFSFPSGTGVNIQVSGYNGSVINQSGFTQTVNVYMEFSYDGAAWRNDLWV